MYISFRHATEGRDVPDDGDEFGRDNLKEVQDVLDGEFGRNDLEEAHDEVHDVLDGEFGRDDLEEAHDDGQDVLENEFGGDYLEDPNDEGGLSVLDITRFSQVRKVR